MPADFGTLNINAAGTPEKFSGDLAASSAMRPNSIVTAITFKAPDGNSGDVFVGRIGRDGTTDTVTSSYGITLGPGDAVSLNDISERFSNFQGDAATSGDDIEWVASFNTGGSNG